MAHLKSDDDARWDERENREAKTDREAPPEIQHSGTDQIICPHCGTAWPLAGIIAATDTGVETCLNEDCEKVFNWRASLSFIFYTTKLEGSTNV